MHPDQTDWLTGMTRSNIELISRYHDRRAENSNTCEDTQQTRVISREVLIDLCHVWGPAGVTLPTAGSTLHTAAAVLSNTHYKCGNTGFSFLSKLIT
jgi:hypothetical protein